jgi:phosphoesterase RecJ-like protein
MVSLYSLLLAVGGVEAVVVIRQENPETCAVGMRSRERVDVACIARNFGGGGHRNAAGASVPGRIKDLLPRIVKSFEGIEGML